MKTTKTPESQPGGTPKVLIEYQKFLGRERARLDEQMRRDDERRAALHKFRQQGAR